METLPLLPLNIEFETKAVLLQLVQSHKALAELKGITDTIPNKDILLSTLSLQEAKDSSEIENIITSHDELYKQTLGTENKKTLAAKEVQHYASSLRIGFKQIKENGLLTVKTILAIQEEIEQNQAGFRKVPGTKLKNDATGEIIYTPPQDHMEIVKLMSNLEKFINDNEISSLDPLIKLGIIHHQFESIHPFYDGNGRTGRIINILYLILNDLLDYPTLYLSRYINKNKAQYYQGLQEVRKNGAWEDWILFILKAIEETAKKTTRLIKVIKHQFLQVKHKIRAKYKFYSQDLINNLFRYPYTKVNFLKKELGVSRITATNYLDQLTAGGILKKEKFGRSNYYINIYLFDILSNIDIYENDSVILPDDLI